MRPDILRRVELRGVRGEVFPLDPRPFAREDLHLSAPMDRTPVPEQDHRTPQVLQQVAQEAPDIQPGEILGADPEVERKTPSLGRDRERADGGEPVVLIEVVEVGRLAPGGPRCA